jgi:hypothetical protein
MVGVQKTWLCVILIQTRFQNTLSKHASWEPSVDHPLAPTFHDLPDLVARELCGQVRKPKGDPCSPYILKGVTNEYYFYGTGERKLSLFWDLWECQDLVARHRH